MSVPRHKFYPGDLVRIADKLPRSMSHFPAGQRAVVLEYSHNSAQRGNEMEHSYVLYLENEGHHAWYDEPQLTLLKRGTNSALLASWEKQNGEPVG